MRLRGGELQVLEVIKKNARPNLETIGHKMVVSPDFVRELCHSLIKGGYLSMVDGGVYKLTREGERMLQPYRTGGIIGMGRRAASRYPILPPLG